MTQQLSHPNGNRPASRQPGTGAAATLTRAAPAAPDEDAGVDLRAAQRAAADFLAALKVDPR